MTSKTAARIAGAALTAVLMLASACSSTRSAWEAARDRNTPGAYQQFLLAHPDSEYTETARLKLADLGWDAACRSNTIESYEAFLAAYPEDPRAEMAAIRAADRLWKQAERDEDAAAYQQYLTKYPNRAFAHLVPQRLDSLSWNEAKRINTIHAYQAHLQAYPETSYKSEAIKQIHNLEQQALAAARDRRHAAMASAIHDGDIRAIEAQLAAGFDINEGDAHGQTALHLAASLGQVTVVDYLLSRDATVDLVATNGWAALHFACAAGQHSVAAHLLAQGASIDLAAKHGDGLTPLMLAAAKRQLSVLSLLIDNGANLHARSWTGDTALHWAARSGDTNVVHLLLKRGAERAPINHRRQTPFDIAAIHGFSSSFEPLRPDNVTVTVEWGGGKLLPYSNLITKYGADPRQVGLFWMNGNEGFPLLVVFPVDDTAARSSGNMDLTALSGCFSMGNVMFLGDCTIEKQGLRFSANYTVIYPNSEKGRHRFY